MLDIGVLGVGHLGRIHLKCIQMVEQLNLVGFYDPDDRNASRAIKEFGIKRFDTQEELIEAVAVVDIVTPTTTHFALAKAAIQKGKHVFIEKPVTQTPNEAAELIQLIIKHQIKAQVGHVERFNPALLALGKEQLNPMFIEAHRLAMFNPRGTDVSVVLDLMIHDLDIVLHLVKSPIKSIHASGVAIVSSTPDISNARIEFENGCIANLTASRISLKQMRKLRLFQKGAYISMDFLKKQSEIIRLYDEKDITPENAAKMLQLDTNDGTKYIAITAPNSEEINAIKTELSSFANSIQQDTKPVVTIEDGYKALRLAHDILQEIHQRNAKLL